MSNPSLWRSRLILVLSLSLCGCATPLKTNRFALEDLDAHAAYAVIGVSKETPAMETRFLWRDESGTTFRWEVETGSGLDVEDAELFLFRLPKGGRYALTGLVDGGKSFEFPPSADLPVVQARNGVITYVGTFGFSRQSLRSAELQPEPNPFLHMNAIGGLRNVYGGYPLINGYNGKVLEVTDINMQVAYTETREQSLRPLIQADLMPCFHSEFKSNPVITGTLLFLIEVRAGRIEDVRLLKSNHTASPSYETCSLEALRAAHVEGRDFKAVYPALFPKVLD